MSSNFMRIIGEISTNIQTFSFNTQKINSYAAKIGTPNETDQVLTEVSRLTQATEELAQRIGDQFKSLNQATASLPPSEQRERRIQANRLRDQFMAVLSQFQKQQREVVERQKSSIQKARASTPSSSATLPPPPSYKAATSDGYNDDDQGGRIDFYQSGDQSSKYETAIGFAALQERERELRRLEGDIVNVNQVFKDMAQLVYEQNTAIDIIEDNIVKADNHVETGKAELEKAGQLKSSARKKKMICCFILVVVLVIIGAILGLYFGLKS